MVAWYYIFVISSTFSYHKKFLLYIVNAFCFPFVEHMLKKQIWLWLESIFNLAVLYFLPILVADVNITHVRGHVKCIFPEMSMWYSRLARAYTFNCEVCNVEWSTVWLCFISSFLMGKSWVSLKLFRCLFSCPQTLQC